MLFVLVNSAVLLLAVAVLYFPLFPLLFVQLQ